MNTKVKNIYRKRAAIVGGLTLIVIVCAVFVWRSRIAATEEIADGEEFIEIKDTDHNSQNSLSWGGTYEGVVPSNNGDIKVRLTINYDGNYEAEYGGSSAKGKFAWGENGMTIMLDSNIIGIPRHYWIGENVLFQVDANGKFVNNPQYTLHMTAGIEFP